MRIYLDTCSLNRPWDDQSQSRVQLETEAILHLIEQSYSGHLDMVSSDYLLAEILETNDAERRVAILELLQCAQIHMAQSAVIGQRASSFSVYHIQGYDALHLAAAEFASVDYFITTDDRLLKRARRAGNLLKIQLLNPIDFPLIR